jgi:hypothetical protein
VLSARGKQQVGIGLAASLIVCAVGIRGLGAICERQLAAPHESAPAAPTVPPLAFEGLYPSDERWESLESGTDEEIDRRIAYWAELHHIVLLDIDPKPTPPPGAAKRIASESRPTISVQIPGSISSASLLRVLQVSRHVNAERVELIGGLTRKLEVPDPFEPAAELMAVVPQATQVQVTFDDADCECTGVAKWTGAGLEVTGTDGEVATWAQAKPDAIASVTDVKRLDFEWTSTLQPMDLVNASLTALSRGSLLVVKVPTPKDPPELP